MKSVWRAWLGVAAAISAVWLAPQCRAQPAPVLPAIAGELAGAVTAWPGAPALRWRCTFLPGGESGTVQAILTGEGEGTFLDVAVWMRADGALDWQLRRAELDLVVWAPALATRWPELWVYSCSGTVSLAGAGRFQSGILSGNATVRLAGGRVENTADQLVVEGIELMLTLDDLARLHSAPGQSLSWRAGRCAEIPLGAGLLQFSLAGETVQVERGEFNVMGGGLRLSPFTVNPSAPELEVVADVEQVDVAALLPLLPPLLSEAQGRLDGRLLLRYGAAGLSIGTGHLALRGGSPAQLRLLPSPGVLSGSLPPKVNELYPGLVRIEMGEAWLLADQLEVRFLPEGDPAGRSATVHLVGGPSDPSLRAPLILDLNIVGPLEPLVNLGVKLGMQSGGK